MGPQMLPYAVETAVCSYDKVLNLLTEVIIAIDMDTKLVKL
jgi:hypothetical protein